MNPYTASLSILHITVGASALIAPAFTVELFGVVPATATTFVTRLSGSRDLVLGFGLWFSPAGNAMARRRLVMMANAINAIDLLSSLVCYTEGNMSSEGVLWSGGAAAIELLLGLIVLREDHGLA